jgi:hypothetical protein
VREGTGFLFPIGEGILAIYSLKEREGAAWLFRGKVIVTYSL